MIKNILLKDAGVKVFSYSCCECGHDNLVYLADSYGKTQTSGAICKCCSEITWCNGRENPILQLLSKPPIDSGVQYQAWRRKILNDFLESFGHCANCQSNEGYEFVSNRPLAKYTCPKCHHVNEKPKLSDVSFQHADDYVLWREF